jgi:hypothetical protein
VRGLPLHSQPTLPQEVLMDSIVIKVAMLVCQAAAAVIARRHQLDDPWIQVAILLRVLRDLLSILDRVAKESRCESSRRSKGRRAGLAGAPGVFHCRSLAIAPGQSLCPVASVHKAPRHKRGNRRAIGPERGRPRRPRQSRHSRRRTARQSLADDGPFDGPRCIQE